MRLIVKLATGLQVILRHAFESAGGDEELGDGLQSLGSERIRDEAARAVYHSLPTQCPGSVGRR